MAYQKRVVDPRIGHILSAMGGLSIEGPRACGKTSTGLRHAASSVRLYQSHELIALAELDPAILLTGDVPRLVDEWQLAPQLWNAIRHEIDDRGRPGQFILSGSARPPDDIRRHSGVGRITRIRMRTMSLTESTRSSGQVSFDELSDGEPLVSVRSELTYQDLASEAIRGGWPALLNASVSDAMEFNHSYCTDLAAVDVPSATGVRHDPVRVRRLLESLARNISTEASLSKITADVAGEGSGISRNTIREYIDALTKVFAYEQQVAWSVSLRSRTRLRQQPKHHLADPALACAALRLSPQRLAADPEFFGQVFEAMAIRDRRAYIEADGGFLYHYRDETHLEVDAILEFREGGWAAIEVKLGSSQIPQAEAALLKLRDERIDVERLGKPDFLAVITGTEYGYTLPSGVHVVPLACLGPRSST